MGVTNEYGRLRKAIVCKPDYFKWLPINDIVKKALASGQTFTTEEVQEQHREFCDALKSAGVELLYIEPNKDCLYQVFTRDFGKATGKGLLLGKFRLPVRQSETNLYEGFFTNQGIPIWGKVSRGFFEGGDIHYMDNETMVCGLGGRSDEEGIEEARKMVKEELGLNLIAVEFPPELIHLDEVFVRVADRLCVACVEVLPDYFLKILKEKRIDIIEVSKEEQREVKCNVVAIDDKTVVSFKENVNTNKKLEALGLEVLKPDISILTRGGGGPRCSCFPLERDEI